MRESITNQEANEIKKLLSENGGKMGVSTVCRKIKSIRRKSNTSWSNYGLKINSYQRYSRTCFAVKVEM